MSLTILHTTAPLLSPPHPTPRHCHRPSSTRPAATERIFFARDPLGRRSLLMHKPTPVSAALLLSSCGLAVDHPLNEWEEVSCDAVHCYQLRDLKGKSWVVSRACYMLWCSALSWVLFCGGVERQAAR